MKNILFIFSQRFKTIVKVNFKDKITHMIFPIKHNTSNCKMNNK